MSKVFISDKIVEAVRRIINAVSSGKCDEIDRLVGELVDYAWLFISSKLKSGSMSVVVNGEKYKVVIFEVGLVSEAVIAAEMACRIGVADMYCTGRESSVALALSAEKGKAVYVWYTRRVRGR